MSFLPPLTQGCKMFVFHSSRCSWSFPLIWKQMSGTAQQASILPLSTLQWHLPAIPSNTFYHEAGNCVGTCGSTSGDRVVFSPAGPLANAWEVGVHLPATELHGHRIRLLVCQNKQQPKKKKKERKRKQQNETKTVSKTMNSLQF